jgi:hypothetical protein
MPPTSTIGALVNSPFAADFKPPQATTAKELTNFVIARQLVAYGRGFDIPYRVMLKQLNRLLKKYGVDLVQRGVVLSLDVAEHPFSAKFVEGRIEDILKIQPYRYQVRSKCQSTTLKASEQPTVPNKSSATSA